MKLLILSDIHANWPALRAVLEAESDADDILCLGDLADYGPQPVECVEWAARHLPLSRVIQGNHDWGIAWNKDPRCSPPYRHLTAVTQSYSQRMLGKGRCSFLRKLLPLRKFRIDEAKCVACHAAPSDPLFHYLNTSFVTGKLDAEIEIAGQPDFLFFGHTHWPVRICSGKTLIVNPGSIGQPKDGDPRAAYAVWNDGEVTLRRAAYDIEETVRAYTDTDIDPEDVLALTEVLRSGGNLPTQIAAEEAR